MLPENLGLVAEEIARLVADRLAASHATNEYLSTEAAATYLGLSTYLLEQWRSHGDGPPYIKLARLVRYSRADLDSWMAERRQAHTAQNR